MNLPLCPITHITYRGSKMSLGTVDGNGAAYVTSERSDPPLRLTAILDADDVALLERLLRDAVGAEVGRGEARTVGFLSSRPVALAVVAAQPEARVVGVRLSHRDEIIQVVMTVKEASDLAAALPLGGERLARRTGEIVGLPGVDSPVLRVRRKADNQVHACRVVDNVSWAQGVHGEPLPLDALAIGMAIAFTQLRVADEDVLLCAAVQPPAAAPRGWKTPPDAALLEICSMGEAVDAAVAAGELDRARALLRSMRHRLSQVGRTDSFVLAKLVLSTLVCELLAGNHWASSLWVGRSGDEELDIGKLFIDQGQTSEHDLMLEFQIAAWFHARNVDAEQGVKGLNETMERICAFARDRDPALLGLTLRNWGLHLQTLFEEGVPPVHAAAWKSACEAYARPVTPTVFALPRPARWVVDWDAEVTVVPTQAPLSASSDGGRRKSWW